MGEQSKDDHVTSTACCVSSLPLAGLAKYAADWQSPPVSIACLVTVNAIYWIVMPMTSTLTLAAILGSLVLLVDLAASLEKLPKAAMTTPTPLPLCHCCVKRVWSSPCRSRVRILIGLASTFGLFLSSFVGLQLSTIAYLGASFYLLSNTLRLADRSNCPLIARIVDNIQALRPDTTSICSSAQSSPSKSSPEPASQTTPVKTASLHFKADPLELELMSPERPASTDDDLAPFLPSQTAAEEDLMSNPESTDDILLPSKTSPVRTSLHLAPDDSESQEEADYFEEFELVDSASDSEQPHSQ